MCICVCVLRTFSCLYSKLHKKSETITFSSSQFADHKRGGWKSDLSHPVIFISPCCLFHSGPRVEQTRTGVVDDGVASVVLTSPSVWECMCGTAEVWFLSSCTECVSVSFSVSRWGGMYPDWGFVCSLRWWWSLGDFGGHRPFLSWPRKPLSLGLQCSRHWRASVERSATRRLSSGAQPLSPSSAPIKRKVRPTWRAGQPQPRSRSGTQRDRGPLRTREVERARKMVCTEMENCHQGPERSIPLTCTFSTEKESQNITIQFMLYFIWLMFGIICQIIKCDYLLYVHLFVWCCLNVHVLKNDCFNINIVLIWY